jgi:hypothetical protein
MIEFRNWDKRKQEIEAALETYVTYASVANKFIKVYVSRIYFWIFIVQWAYLFAVNNTFYA